MARPSAAAGPTRKRRRWGIAATVALAHLAIAYLVVTGSGARLIAPLAKSVAAIQLLPPVPPPAPPPEARIAEKSGEAAPPARKARPKPVTAPPPKVRTPPPVAAPPVAADGPDTSAGAALPGPGTGAGGTGGGLGAGGQGDGTGSGGAPARLIRGRIRSADYPRDASRARAGGSSTVHLDVDERGYVTRCRIARSSGRADLDDTTCRLATERFRYDPARDAAGRPVPTVVGWRQDWWLEGRD